MSSKPKPEVQFAVLSGVACAIILAAIILSDLTYWARYIRVYPFDSFIDNPFPTVDRLYPQERVAGVAKPRSLPYATPDGRTIGDHALAAAAAFAEGSHSTALIIYHDGRIQLERYWLGADASTPVYSFSMHKSVVALLLGLAIEDGAVGGVDESLVRYLPEWGGDRREAITLRNTLQMNSGFETMRFPTNPFSKHVKRQIGTDLTATALSFRLQETPGEVFDYNGVNPTLLLMVVERATGRRYADYLSERLWKPLGNRDATVWLDSKGGLARGATSLYAVPMDWLRIGVMLLDDGVVDGKQIVPRAWLREMLTPSATSPLYGMLMWIGTEHVKERSLESFKGFAATAEEPFMARDVIFFDGLGGQRVYIIPSRQVVIVRTGVLSRTWEDTKLPNIVIEALDGISPQTKRNST